MKNSMYVSLVSNFNSIQKKIESICEIDKLDVKHISDLERYIGMQCNILDALNVLGEITSDGEKNERI